MKLIFGQDKDKRSVYLLLSLGCVAISFNTSAIAAAIPSIASELRLSDITVSRIISFYMVPYGIGALIYAPLVRFFSYRKILASTMFLYAISSVLCSSGSLIDNLLWARIGMGLTGASIIPLGLMIIGDYFQKNIRGRLVGMFFACSFFASLAGVALIGVANWRWLFLVPAVLALGIAICCVFLKSPIFDTTQKGNINYLKAFRDIRIKNVFIFIFVISALYHGVCQWFGVYLDNIYHLPKTAISLFFILASVGGFVGQNIGGHLSDKRGRMIACYTGFVLLASATVLLAGNYPAKIFCGLMIAISMGWTISHNGVSTILTDFPESDRAVIASLNSAVRFISGGLGFYLSSFFVKHSFGLTFFIIGILMFILVFLIKYIIIYAE